jgi:hypothetical protein
MFEVPSAQFARLLPLFDPDEPHSAWVFSSLEGRTLGKAYVDNIDKPVHCLLTTNFLNLTCLSEGMEQQWLNQAVTELRQGKEVILNWVPRIAARLQPPDHPVAARDSLAFCDCRPGPALDLPEGHHFRAIDKELIKRCLWGNAMLEAYGTTDNFLRDGIGICLMADDEICCEAYGAFLGAGKYDLGIITHEKYRRQGHAYLTSSHLIHLCAEQGYATTWSCFQSNVGSAATARKLGYQTETAYQWLYYSPIL